MEAALQFAPVVLMFVLAAALPIAFFASLLVGSRSRIYIVGIYLACILYFPNNSYGLLNPDAGDNFYSRGSGMFHFSLINLFLYALAIQAFISRRFATTYPVHHNIATPGWIFLLLFLGNIVVGTFTPKVEWYHLLDKSGLINVINLILLFYVLINSLRTPKDFDTLIKIFLICAVTRAIWGLFRFVFLGGDPANYYANFQKLDVKLTFFDINDGLIAAMAMFAAVWKLTSRQAASQKEKLLWISIIAIELLTIVLSYRRTGWLGLALVAVLIATLQPVRARLFLFLSYICIGLPLLIYKNSHRFSESGTLLESIAPDIVSSGSLSLTTGRFAELYAAWLSVRESPWFGLGLWGQFDAFRFSELHWHNGNFGWMHSGILHIMLKTGLFGVATLLLAVFLYLRFVCNSTRSANEVQREFVLMGFCGFLFSIPNFLVGTPIIEFRTMQLLGFCLALPYLAHAAAKGNQKIVADRVFAANSRVARFS